MAGDDAFQVLRQSPRMSQPGAGFAVIETEGLGFALEDIHVGGCRQQIGIRVGMGHEQAEPPDIVEEAGGVGAVIAALRSGAGHGEFFTKHAARQAMTPDAAQQIEPQSRVQEALHGDGEREAANRLQAEQGDGVLNAADARGKTVEGRVDHTHEFGGEGGIGADQLHHLADMHVFGREQA